MPKTPVPLMSGPWKPLSAAESNAFLERLGMALAQTRGPDTLPRRFPILNLRAMPLSFYPGWLLVEGEAQMAPGIVGTFNVVYGPGFMWVVDGDSRVLHDLNAGRIPRDAVAYVGEEAVPGRSQAKAEPAFVPSPLAPWTKGVTVPDFLRFFCACVWGQDGPFHLLEHADSPLLQTLDVAALDWADRIRPLEVREDEQGFVVEGLVAYARTVFWACFCLSTANASVLMKDDEPVAVDVLPEQTHRSPFRDVRQTGNRAEPQQG